MDGLDILRIITLVVVIVALIIVGKGLKNDKR